MYGKTFKKALAILLTLMMLLSSVPVMSVSATTTGTTSDGLEYTIENGEATITGYIGDAAELTIPETIEGYLVTKLGNRVFEGCTSLKSITIPDSVTAILDSAFLGCTNLESIIIPDSVTYIYQYAFKDCTSLTSITIPDSITCIYDYLFEGCTSLKSITIPDSVTNIGEDAFYRCTSLENITIPDSVTSIGGGAFYGCASLKNITIPDSVTSIGGGAFNNTAYYNDTDNWNDGVLYIGLALIEADTSLSGNYTIKPGTVVIAESAFSGCISLESITIPDSNMSIEDYAFSGCMSLESITIPSSVTHIGSSAFANTAYYNDANNWNDEVLYIGSALIKADTSLNGSCIIKSGTTILADDSFYNCKNLESITIPDSVSNIGGSVFYYCSNLKDVYISDIYAWCNIDFEEYFSSPLCYADNLYLNNEPVKDIVIPDGVNSIPYYAFSCASLESITIPESVTTMYDYAFDGCTSLNNVTISEGLTNIAHSAFADCTSLENIILPNSVTIIDSYAFIRCTSLSNIIIPEKVTSIGHCAFQHCSSLEKITMNNAVTSIGTEAFRDCTDFTSITLPHSIKSIGNGVFRSCDALQHVYYTGTEEEWNSIEIGSNNSELTNATRHYNSIGEFTFVRTVEAGCFEGGYDLYHCTECGEVQLNSTKPAHKFEDGICFVCSLNEADAIESYHPYNIFSDKSWTISKPGATGISVTFIEKTEVESGHDYIYIYDMYDNQIGKYSGTELAGKTIAISGDMVRIRLTSNSSVTYYGFAITKVVADYSEVTTLPTNISSVSTNPDESTVATEATTIATDPVESSTAEAEPTEATTKATDAATITTDPAESSTAEAESTEATTKATEATTIATDPAESSTAETETTDVTAPVKVMTDEKSQISVEINEDTDAILKVEEITDNNQIEKINLILADEKVVKLYDITLDKDGVAVQPDGCVTVRIPADSADYNVYRVESDGTLTNMNAEFVDGCLVFTTEHFSLYAVAGKDTEPSTPAESEFEVGDANMDGKINIKDATTIQKYAAKMIELDDTALALADFNADNKINVKDATQIQKKIAGLI